MTWRHTRIAAEEGLLYSFLTSILNRRQWQTSCPGHITFRQSNLQYQLDRKLGGVEHRSGSDILEMKKISWHCQKSNPGSSGSQPGHFTDCDFPVAPLNLCTHCNV